MEQKFSCRKHGEYAGKLSLFRFPGTGETKEIKPLCPECEKEIKTEELRKNKESEKSEKIRRMRSMNIEPRFYEAGFENFAAYNGELKNHLEICRSYAENPRGKLVMIGGNGSGKTHLAVSILKKLGGAIFTAYEIAVNIRQSYGSDAKEFEAFEKLCRTPLLIIDEAEKIKDSEAKNNWMSYVIGKRHDRMLPLILIANCHKQSDCRELVKPCRKCLEYHLENDVLSRFIEDGIVLDFRSGDYREKIRDARFRENNTGRN